MFWTTLIPHVTVSVLFIGLVLHALRRYNRRMDEQIRRHHEWAEAEDAKWDAMRAEVKASMSARTDQLIAEAKATMPAFAACNEQMANTNGFHHPEAHDADAPRLDSSATP